ncbi:831_t:CDS:2 [Racocetra persica]|uniref:831_t:CDS:1 n=1 Tax=Racocetra persica TaxID=160502 RepID=A0ACA9N2B1_9GLOM|nr:831_t:CDS:2 [Racocetra persica]
MKSLKEKILKYANWLCLGSRTKDDKGKNREEDGELPNNQTINPSIPPQENDRKTGKKTINYCANDPNFNMDLCPCCQMNPKNDTNNDDLTLPLRLYCAYSNTICEISQLCEYDLSNPDSEQQVIELKNCKIIVASERIRKNAQHQNSVKEMHREVPMMATYYKNAKDCLVMLEEDTDVTSIIEKIDLICDDINKDKKPAREKVEELSLNTAELLNNSKFAWDPWFERI